MDSIFSNTPLDKVDYDLVVDSREQNNVRKVLDQYGIKYKLRTLDTGDYLIKNKEGHEVLLERKQMTDFISSMMDGRLESQMRRMSQHPMPMLLLTGSFAEYRKYAKTTKLTADHVIGAVASCVVKYGLRCVMWVQSADNKPHATGVVLATRVMKKISEGKLDKIPPRKIKGKHSLPQVEILHILCGIPVNVAEELLTKFGSVRSVIDGNDEDLLTVRGMGRTRLLKMRKLLGDIE